MELVLLVFVFIIIAIGLTWFFLAKDRGTKEPVSALWIALGFGVIGAVAAGFTESLLIPIKALHGGPLGEVLLASLAVGVIEELFKFLPLALFIYRKSYFNEHTDGVIYFAIAGLGFGIPENILYSVQFGSHAAILRLFLTPIFHAATTGFVGYFLIKSKIDHKPLITTGLALAFAMIMHGLYDFGLSSGIIIFVVMSFMITIGMSVGLFILYARASELDKEQGLSVVGNNSFCRSCGTNNPSHNLYCAHCGKYA